MKGYRKKTRTAPRKNVKNKFVVTYAGFKTPTEATACAADTSTETDKQENKADEQRTDFRTASKA